MAYFLCALPTTDAPCRYNAREILGMLSDPFYLRYFYFVSPVVAEFEGVNALFQATDSDPEKKIQEMALHYKSLQAKLLTIEGNYCA